MADQSYYEIQGTDLLGNFPTQRQGSDRALKGHFNGPTEPPSPTAYQDWLDTTSGFWKRRNAANDAWIVVGLIGTPYSGALPLSGGTMTGDINMASLRKITNLPPASATGDAVRKAEFDLKANLAAPQFTGDAQVNQDPIGNNSLVRRVWTEGRYLKLAGGTLTAPLVLSGDGSANLNPVSIQQLKTYVLFNTATGHSHDGTNSRRVLGIDVDSQGFGAGTKLVANGSGECQWSSNQAVVRLTVPSLAVDADPVPGTYTTVSVAGSVSSTSNSVLLGLETFDSLTLRFRVPGESSDSSEADIRVTGNATPTGTPGYQNWVSVNNFREFEYRKVSGGASRVIIRVLGYGQI